MTCSSLSRLPKMAVESLNPYWSKIRSFLFHESWEDFLLVTVQLCNPSVITICFLAPTYFPRSSSSSSSSFSRRSSYQTTFFDSIHRVRSDPWNQCWMFQWINADGCRGSLLSFSFDLPRHDEVGYERIRFLRCKKAPISSTIRSFASARGEHPFCPYLFFSRRDQSIKN